MGLLFLLKFVGGIYMRLNKYDYKALYVELTLVNEENFQGKICNKHLGFRNLTSLC